MRDLPGVDAGAGQTAAPNDDVYLSIRGIGQLETTTLLDGHPTGAGLSRGYNYEISPAFALRRVQVLYGSGSSGFYGVDAIGGVVDMQTLEPTLRPETTFTQGWGTFEKAATSFSATGTTPGGALGYAVAYGTQGIDGPFHHALIYNPSAAFDQSATDPAVHNLGAYDVDTSAVNRSALAKIRLRLKDNARFTLSTLSSTFYDNKTGNGDNDYLPYNTALATAQQSLANKSASDPCPAGTFTATNANGVTNGTGPNGQPDGGLPCQTPQQWAQFNTGWQGAGSAWQSFKNQDVHGRLDVNGTHSLFTLDTFSNIYAHHYDRSGQLPFNVAPGDNSYTYDKQVTNSGFTVSQYFTGVRNEFGLGYYYDNTAYLFHTNGAFTSGPLAHESAIFLKDALHVPGSHLTTYGNLWFKHSTLTNTSYVDPRLAFVYEGKRDVFRLAAGETSTQPYAAAPELSAPGSLNGNINCSSLNSVGSAPSSVPRPERGVDEEATVAHRWYGDSSTQLTLYNVNVIDKLYSILAPLSQTGTGFIDPGLLAQYEAKIAAQCGAANPLDLLAVTSQLNLGHVVARGIDLSGHQSLRGGFYLDYDWEVQSSLLAGADVTVLQNNLDLIPGSQLPGVPLHTYMLGLGWNGANTWSARLDYHHFAENNQRHAPAYGISDLTVVHDLGPGRITVNVTNLFNQDADYRGLIGEGYPLALNQYATAADYQPYVGTASTEGFGLPFRQVFITYTIRTR